MYDKLPESGQFRGPSAAVEMFNFEDFLQHSQEVRGFSPDTVRAYRSDLKFFATFLADEGVAHLTRVDHPLILRYIERMKATRSPRTAEAGLSDATIARRLAAVSSFFVFMRGTKYPKLADPVKAFNRRWKRNNRPKPVGHDLISQLLKTITVTRDRILIELFLASGLRLSEMAQLDRDSIKAEVTPEMVLGVGEVVGKGGKRRAFYIHKRMLVPLSIYIRDRKDEHVPLFISERGKRMSARAMQERMAHWCRKAGIPHVNLHRLRHTYATNLVNAEMDILQIKELMGHNSIATTMQYAKLNDVTLARGYHAAMEFVDLGAAG